ncbi:MAG: hypothetical protein JO322_11455 [Candidatus Eremiobacteraeota bacterium]|nr:hypothetical protein [Candidatus Eremiobacteraeota bacterium]
MSTMIQGAIAGAVGTMALDITGYTDMAVRGRSASGLPAEVIKRFSQRAGIPIENDNRASAVGAIGGYMIGVAIGALYGAVRSRVPRAPLILSTIALGAAAMAAADLPATRIGATDPRTWGITGWLSDIFPHAAYGLVTAAVFDAVSNGVKPAESTTTLAELDAVVVEIDDLSD